MNGESECFILRINWISVKGVVWQEFAAKPRKTFELIFPTFQKLDLIFFYRRASGSNFFFLVNLLTNFFFSWGTFCLNFFFPGDLLNQFFFAIFTTPPPR